MNKVSQFGWHILCRMMPKLAVKIQYRYIMGEKIDLKNPKDLNEKINYLKFHANLNEWARLADKYEVREYVKERGLGQILVSLYGKYYSSSDLIEDWKNLPVSFVIKSNHACGTVLIVKDKNTENLNRIKKETEGWLKIKFGEGTNEPHYKIIKPCLIVEELLEEDNNVFSLSKSLIDYKIWCFDGKPYCILVVVNRDRETHRYQLDTYDLDWNRIEGALTSVHGRPSILPKPQNLDYMLECASILSSGHKQVRVDLYNINGKIYFGEMTFTSQGGYMNYFTKEFLLEMGCQFEV